jgi:hypothetical protein
MSPQAENYIRNASEAEVRAVEHVLDCLESGDPDCWDTLPQSELLTEGQFGRMVILLPSGDVLIWRDYADYPELYAVFYIGPASSFY